MSDAAPVRFRVVWATDSTNDVQSDVRAAALDAQMTANFDLQIPDFYWAGDPPTGARASTPGYTRVDLSTYAARAQLLVLITSGQVHSMAASCTDLRGLADVAPVLVLGPGPADPALGQALADITEVGGQAAHISWQGRGLRAVLAERLLQDATTFKHWGSGYGRGSRGVPWL